jgi:hypothetical protein
MELHDHDQQHPADDRQQEIDEIQSFDTHRPRRKGALPDSTLYESSSLHNLLTLRGSWICRTSEVLSKTLVTPRMLRIVLGGEDLADFTTCACPFVIPINAPQTRTSRIAPSRITGAANRSCEANWSAGSAREHRRIGVRLRQAWRNHRRALIAAA